MLVPRGLGFLDGFKSCIDMGKRPVLNSSNGLSDDMAKAASLCFLPLPAIFHKKLVQQGKADLAMAAAHRVKSVDNGIVEMGMRGGYLSP